MAKNSQVIEMQAVDVLSLVISETQKLVPQISKGTTEPSWDGYIEIYDNPSLTKNAGLRRSPVQVKGHYKESILELGQPEIKHFVDISDLKAYYKEGGTAYFVVNIHDRKHYSIYYNMFTPYDLSQWIELAGSQTGITIPFSQFPEDNPDEIYAIICTFWADCKKQGGTPYLGSDGKRQITDYTRFDHLSFGVSGAKDPLEHMLNHPIIIYGTMPEVSVAIKKVQFSQISTEVKEDVCVNDKIYFHSYTIQKTNDNEKILLGNVLELYVKETSLALHLLQEEYPQPISDVMAALSFLLALTNSAEIRIGESFHCQVDFSESIARNRAEMQKRYDGLQNLQKALAFLGVTKDILISDNIEHSEMNCIIAICHAMMNEGIIHPGEPLKVGVMGIFHVFDARLLLRVEQVGELTYKLSNMFLNPCKNGKLGVDGPPCSVFIIMKEDDFENLDNIDYTALVEDLFSYTLNDEYSCAINQLLLRMLNAYDKTGNPDLIRACEEVSRKLFEYHTDDFSNLNYFQCVKRQRELSGEEMEQLYSMRLRQQPNLSIQLGIAILLENETDVRYHFSHLDSQNQDEFLSYPICNLSTYLAAQCKQRGSADKPNE